MNSTIIYVGEFVLPDKSASANRVVSNGKVFGKLGYNTVFLGASADNSTFDGIRKVDGFENMYEEAHPSTSVQWLKHIFSVKNIVKLVKQYEDVRMIILYNLPVLTVVQVKRAFRKQNIQIVYDCTEWTTDTNGSLLKKIFKAVDEFFVRNTLTYIADGIIAISNMMMQKYKKCRKLVKIPPLIDTEEPIWHQKRDRNDENFEFCFAGIPDGKKESLDKVVSALASIESENIRLKIVGVTADEFCRMYPELSQLSADLRIEFKGRVSHEQAVKSIIDCDCYIFIREADRRNNAGFPTKFAEAYTCSAPVITTKISDVESYFINDEKGVLLDDSSVESIAEAMIRQIEKGRCECQRELDSAFSTDSFVDDFRLWFEK